MSESKPMLSVLVAHKDRYVALNRCWVSICEVADAMKQRIQFIVADFADESFADFRWWIHDLVDLKVVPIEGPFSRGKGLNVASEFVEGSAVVLCDADCVVLASAVETALYHAIQHETTVFPVISMLDSNGNHDGWCELGYGVSFHSASRFAEYVVPEFYSWGGEDVVLFSRVSKRHRTIRYRENGIRHVWHSVEDKHKFYRNSAHSDYQSEKPYVPILEWHAAHVCNLTCGYCAHYSNYHVKGIVPLSVARQDFSRWAGRLNVRQFAILGGEPTLNPELGAIAKLAKNAFDAYEGIIVSNGFFLDRHPDLPKIMCDYNYRLELSQHGTNPSYLEKFNKGVEIARQWQRDFPKLVVKVRPCHTNWVAMYDMRPDGKAYPVADNGDAQAAWDCCKQRYCMPLFQGRLWKCPALAYFQHLDEKLKLQDIREWDSFREYQSLAPEATLEEARAFVNSKAIPQCAVCPSKEIRVEHSSGI